MNVGTDKVSTAEKIFEQLANTRLKHGHIAHTSPLFAQPCFKTNDIARFCERSTDSIRKAHNPAFTDSPVPEPAKTSTGRRVYGVEDLWRLHDRFGQSPRQLFSLDRGPRVYSLWAAEGGHHAAATAMLAISLVTKGLRVCVVDCEGEAAFTRLLGVAPDEEVSRENTIAPRLDGLLTQQTDATHLQVPIPSWHGLSYVPANSELHSAEFSSMTQRGVVSLLLRELIEDLRAVNDVVLLVARQRVGVLSLNVASVSEGSIFMVPATTPAQRQSTHFWHMLSVAISAGSLNSDIQKMMLVPIVLPENDAASHADISTDIAVSSPVQARSLENTELGYRDILGCKLSPTPAATDLANMTSALTSFVFSGWARFR